MDEATGRFIEKMGLQFEADAMPRIAGRIFGLLLVHAEPCSLDELAERLKVSRASVSSNTRLLERIGALERVTKPGDRKDYYRMSANLHTRILALHLEHMGHMRDLLREALGTPGAECPGIRDRLTTFCAFFDHMARAIREAGGCWLNGERADAAGGRDPRDDRGKGR